MKAETFWVVQFKEGNGRWGTFTKSLHLTRREAIEDHEQCLGMTWKKCRDLRCVKARVVPVKGATDV